MSTALLPAASPPPGYPQDFEHPELKHNVAGPWISITGMIIMTLFIMLRMYTKVFLARAFGIDDVALLLAWLISIGLQVMVVYLWDVRFIGVHLWNLFIDQVNLAVLLISVCSILYVPLMALAKLSLLLFYRKLSVERSFSIAVYAVMGFIVSYSVAIVLALVFACVPLEQNWDITITTGHCVNKGVIYLATAGLNAATDFILLLLPIPMIAKLHVPTIQKMGLVAMFSIGSLTIVTSLIRLSLLPPLVSATDTTWAVSTPAIWICVEANLVIICGALPTMRLFFRHVAPRLIGEHSDPNSMRPRISLGRKRPSFSVAELSNLNCSRKRQSVQKAYNRMADLDEWEKDLGVEDGSATTYTMDSTGRIVASGTPAVSSPPADTTNWPLPAEPETALPRYDKRSSEPVWLGQTPPEAEGAAPSFLMAKDHTGRLSLRPRAVE